MNSLVKTNKNIIFIILLNKKKIENNLIISVFAGENPEKFSDDVINVNLALVTCCNNDKQKIKKNSDEVCLW